MSAGNSTLHPARLQSTISRWFVTSETPMYGGVGGLLSLQAPRFQFDKGCFCEIHPFMKMRFWWRVALRRDRGPDEAGPSSIFICGGNLEKVGVLSQKMRFSMWEQRE